jgi:pyridoxal phosphate-dependent aminotransferase EpsN
MTVSQSRPRIHLSVPHMSGLEAQFVEEAFQSNWLSTVGPNLDAFEEEVVETLGGGLHAVAVSTGTAALHLALRAVGVRPGDRVAVSTLTFAGSVFPVLYLGAKPVFIDSEEQSWNIDPNLVEEHFRESSRTGNLPKALIVVHLYGQHADLDPLVELCERFGVTLIEDAAESLGGTYKGRQTATTAPFSILSFNGNKMITTTGGGMVVTKDSAAAARIRKWANQSREPAVEYVHEELGYNYRLSNVLAGIGRGQLKVLSERVEQRRNVAERYQAAFADIEDLAIQPEVPWGRHSRWLSVFTLSEEVAPGAIVRALDAEDIEARPIWRPMHTQPLLRSARKVGGTTSERLFATGLCLPSSSSLSDAEQDRVVAAVRRALDARMPSNVLAG